MQTVTEIWHGDRLARILITDTTQRLEAKTTFLSTYSMHDPYTRELTATMTQVQEEYPF